MRLNTWWPVLVVLSIALLASLTASLSKPEQYSSKQFGHNYLDTVNFEHGRQLSSDSSNTQRLQALLDDYLAEVIFSAGSSILIQNHNIFARDTVPDTLNKHSRTNELRIADNDWNRVATNIANITSLYPNIKDLNNRIHKLVVDPIISYHRSERSGLLIVIHSSNQLPLIILSLQHLQTSRKVAEILVIDDHSEDGTAEYLLKRGFAVVKKPIASGTTDSWNQGLHLAIAFGYQRVLFMTADTLLTSEAVKKIHEELAAHPLVVPLTSPRVAASVNHQSILKVHNLLWRFQNYVEDARHAEFIQQSLTKTVFPPGHKQKAKKPALSEKNQTEFLTFCFGVNLELMQPALQHATPAALLFDPKLPFASQGQDLARRMDQVNLVPMVLHTVFALRMQSATAKLDASSHSTASIQGVHDVPTEAYRSFGDLDMNMRSSVPCIYPSQWQLHCTRLLLETTDESQTKQLQVSVPQLLSTTNSGVLVVAIAISNPETNPSAGDIYTARELGHALQSQYAHVKVKYLARGVQWYSAQLLHDVDVLITMLDQYDLREILPQFISSTPKIQDPCVKSLQLKPSLITVAWMRNWFHRWLSRPWIGNYDVLLTSSQLSRDFFERIMTTMGLSRVCNNACPPSVRVQGVEVQSGQRRDVPLDLFATRHAAPTLVYPLATSIQPLHQAEFVLKHHNSFRLRAKELFTGVDYIFTGSYFNVYRRIMDFDPGVLPRWKGRIVGNNWQRANVSFAWKQSCTGLLPYEVVKEAYRFVKIVIDDANDATYPWGSTNSRVFDALASGSLVLSNGEIGMEEVFGYALTAHNLSLPVFHSAAELQSLLDYYLLHETERNQLIQIMQRVVLTEHSYVRRAQQLGQLLNDTFGIHLRPRRGMQTGADSSRRLDETIDQSVPHGHGAENQRRLASATTPSVGAVAASAPSSNLNGNLGVCVGVRTMHTHEDWLPIFVRSLIVQHSRSPHRSAFPLQIFLVDTEGKAEFTRSLMDLVDRHNDQFRYPYLHVLASAMTTATGTKNTVFGYDDTDRLLEVMLTRYHHCDAQSNSTMLRSDTVKESRYVLSASVTASSPPQMVYKHASASLPLSSCGWALFSNGDNMYNAAWFKTVVPLALSGQYDIIGWDFVTHHPRGPNNDIPNTHISVALERKFVDLAAVMVRTELYVKTGAQFLSESVFTTDLFARDYMTLRKLMTMTTPERIKLIPQVLLLHQ